MVCTVTSPVELSGTKPFSAESPTDYNAAGQMQLLNAAAAEELYRAECHRNNVNVNNSFCRQLLLGATVFDFDNGYLGERGIVPIFFTLQRLAVVELSMRSCELSVDDIALLHKTFLQHKTLKKIDLRGVALPVASARHLLALAFENSGVTEVLIDQDTPKYLSIQRQCYANANATILASRCLVCARPVVHSPDQRVEGRLLLALGDAFAESAASAPAAVGIQLLTMFRCVLACCDANNGVLFLCSSECTERITADIGVSMRAVVDELTSSEKAVQPKSVILSRSVTDTLRIIAKADLCVNSDNVATPAPNAQSSFTNKGYTKTNGERHGCDNSDVFDGSSDDIDEEEDGYSPGSNIMKLMKDSTEEDAGEQCTICGRWGACLTDTPQAVMQQICFDIKHSTNGTLQPSALLRLTRLMVQYAAGLRACTHMCVRHFVRFGLYGYGGVAHVRTASGDPHVTIIGLPLDEAPSEDFAIVNFAASHVDDQEEEDITCALTVASAMTDIEGVPIDPYMIFAVGRHLAKMPTCSLGVGLRYACEAVRMYGCLPVSMSPFNRQREKPPRWAYVNWSEWNAVADVQTIVRTAFSRRRPNVYVVEGPHKNLFDNIRAVLWAFREQRRAVLVAMKFCIEWLSVPRGVIPNEKTPYGGFLTTLKIVGQTNINNCHHLICQANFGSLVGNGGIFYIPRGLFNLYTAGAAYIFVGASALRAQRGVPVALYMEQVLSPRLLRLSSDPMLLKELFFLCKDALSWQQRRSFDDTDALSNALHRIPPALFSAFYSRSRMVSDSQDGFLVVLRRAILVPRTRSLLLFLLHELLGSSTTPFVAWLLRALSPLLSQRLGLRGGAAALIAQAHRRLSHVQWNPLEAARRAVTSPPASDQPGAQPPGTQRAKAPGARRPSRKPARGQSAGAKHTRDAVRTRLDQAWSMARAELCARRAEEEAAKETRRVSLFQRTLLNARAMANDVEEIDPGLIGRPWHVVRLCTDAGALSDEALFFIGNHTCRFNVVNQTVVTPLHSMLEEVSTVEFPFAAGFDCAMNSPANPRVVYFFCGEYWLEWDAHWQTCTSGPFRIRMHHQFAALPPAFHRGVDAVVSVPNSTLAIFFVQLQYVVFDCESQKVLGQLRRIDGHDGKRDGMNNSSVTKSANSDEDSDSVVFNAELAALFPLGPMTALVMPLDDDNEDNEEKEEGKEDDIQEEKPHTEGQPRANKKCGAVMLIGCDGQTTVVRRFCSHDVSADDVASKAATATQGEVPLSSTVLSRLPIEFRQMTTAALSALCDTLLTRECAARGCHIVDTASDVSATAFVDAVHTRVNSPFGNLMPSVSLTMRGLISRYASESDTAAALLALSRCAGHLPLLRDEVVLSVPPDEAEEIALIAADFGAGSAISFGALVVVLDLTRVDPRLLRAAPLEAVVESSADGVGFVRHARVSLAPRATALCWGEAPAARVWRLRFLSPLPSGAGVARVLWRPVASVPSSAPLDPTSPLGPSAARAADVCIAAPRIMAEPKRLIDALAPEAVFASRATAAGWRAPHCVLPLLSGPACLFFCGDGFVQLEFGGDRGARRVVALAGHPAFAALPQPFAQGFDAAFYPLPDAPNVVALLRGGKLMHWNLDTGRPASDLVEAHTTYFNGIPWPMNEVETIVQVWDRPGEVLVVRNSLVLRWSIARGVQLDEPLPIQSCPQLFHEAFSGKPLLCATALPHEPCRYYVFCEDCVAVNTVDSNVAGKRTTTTAPTPVRNFDEFSTVSWYLAWGELRHDCVIRLNFREEQPLIVGIIMRSSEPGDTVEEWLVEYSDDNVEWNTVGRHQQCTANSRTMWSLASVAHSAHPLWRLTYSCSNIIVNKNSKNEALRYVYTENRGDRTHEKDSLLYSHLSFITLDAIPYRISPRSIAFTGTLSASASELLINDDVTIAFERSAVLAESVKVVEKVKTEPYLAKKSDASICETAANSIPHHIMADYGESSPELMAFECNCIAGPVRDVWSVWCSDDGEEWEHCGTWRSKSNKFKASWTPRGRRYWRIELYSKLSNIVYDNLCFYEYVGSSVTVERTSIAVDNNEWDPSLLWVKNSPDHCISPLLITAHVGNAIVLNTKLHFVSVMGVHLFSSENQHTSTKFAVDYSEDGITWRSLGVTFFLCGKEVSAKWGTVGSYQFWRLRILEHAGSTSLFLRDVRFETAQPSLYRSVRGESSGLELNLTDGPEEIVAVQTKLPPGSRFVIEKLSLDGISWEAVGAISNDDTRRARAVRQGWIPQGSSSKWRLRPEQIFDETCGSAMENQDVQNSSRPESRLSHLLPRSLTPIEDPVEWLVFSGKAVVPVDFAHSPLLDVLATDFEEPQAARRLTETTQAVVLRSSCQVTTASIAWSFGGNDIAPRFHQVVLSGRTAVNPNIPPVSEAPTSPLQEEKVGLPASTTQKARRRKMSVVAEPTTEVKVEEPVVKPMCIIVEISGNGIDYVPIAKRPFAQVCNALAWKSRMTAPHWRIRFTDIPKTDFLELWRVTWLIDIGVSTFVTPRALFPISNSLRETWLQESFNNEKDFCQLCREGYDQARSVVSGLREPQDIERHGKVAQYVSNLRTKFVALVSKISKEATKEKNPPVDKFISIGRSLGNDIMYLLYKAANRYDCNVDELNELIAHPMLFSQNVARLKEGITWFYPKFEQAGSLVESFYGFQKVSASFSVLWSLSLAVQCDMDCLKNTSIHPLSPHLASVFVTVKIDQGNWIASEHFPGLPLLYHSGFTERPVVIVFAQNQITFTSKYNLTIPDDKPFPALHPFSVFPGVNFIQRIPLSSCPCPIYDCLQLIYKAEFLSTYETEIVFNSISMNSDTASVRFTLPGTDINFALKGLYVGSIEFEAVFVGSDVPRSPKSPVATDVNRRETPRMCVQRMTFVIHDATYSVPYSSGDAEPISIAGYINNTTEKITMCGILPSARIPLKSGFKDAFITDVQVSFDLDAGESLQTFRDPTLLVEGFLTTPRNGTYACRIQRSRQHSGSTSLTLCVPMIQLAEFIRLGEYLVAAESNPPKPTDWTHEAPIFLSAELQMAPSRLEFCGRGVIEFAGFRGEAYVTMTDGGTNITATLPLLRIGGVTLLSRKPGELVTIDIFAPLDASCVVKIDGYSSLLAPQSYPTRVEISRVGVMCVSSGPLYDVCIEEDALFPSGAYAQISVLEQPIMDELSELLQRTPLVASLLAKGMTFSFKVREVVAEPCPLDRQLLVLSVCGVLFGCYFDVMTTVVHPENTLFEAKRICVNLLPLIIEQCDEPLWASYEMFVGLASHKKKCSLSLDNQSNGEIKNNVGEEAGVEKFRDLTGESDEESTDECIDSVLGQHHVRIPEGEFLGRWLVRECEAMDKEMDEDF